MILWSGKATALFWFMLVDSMGWLSTLLVFGVFVAVSWLAKLFIAGRLGCWLQFVSGVRLLVELTVSAAAFEGASIFCELTIIGDWLLILFGVLFKLLVLALVAVAWLAIGLWDGIVPLALCIAFACWALWDSADNLDWSQNSFDGFILKTGRCRSMLCCMLVGRACGPWSPCRARKSNGAEIVMNFCNEILAKKTTPIG